MERQLCARSEQFPCRAVSTCMDYGAPGGVHCGEPGGAHYGTGRRALRETGRRALRDRCELHWQSAQSAHDEPAAPAQLGWISRESQVREAGEKRGERGLALQAGEGRAEAVVDAVPVAEVLVVAAGEVEDVGVPEPLRVAVRRREDDEDRIAGGDVLPADGQRPRGEPPGGQLDGPVVAKEFLHAGFEEGRLLGREGTLELCPLLGVGEKGVGPVADQVDGGLKT